MIIDASLQGATHELTQAIVRLVVSFLFMANHIPRHCNSDAILCAKKGVTHDFLWTDEYAISIIYLLDLDIMCPPKGI